MLRMSEDHVLPELNKVVVIFSNKWWHILYSACLECKAKGLFLFLNLKDSVCHFFEKVDACRFTLIRCLTWITFSVFIVNTTLFLVRCMNSRPLCIAALYML